MATEKGWPLMNTAAARNPFILDGYEALDHELSEGLLTIDAVLVPVGSGHHISGVWNGFDQLYRVGMVLRSPRPTEVQSSESCPIVRAFSVGFEAVPRLLEPCNTMAAALILDAPSEKDALALYKIRETRGGFIAVSDEAILSACQSLEVYGTIPAKSDAAIGLVASPAAAKQRLLNPGKQVVCVLIGDGLKDVDPFGRRLPSMVNIAAETSGFTDAYTPMERKCVAPC